MWCVSFLPFFSVSMLFYSTELWWFLDCLGSFPSHLSPSIFLPFLHAPLAQACTARHLPLLCSETSLDFCIDYWLGSWIFSVLLGFSSLFHCQTFACIFPSSECQNRSELPGPFRWHILCRACPDLWGSEWMNASWSRVVFCLVLWWEHWPGVTVKETILSARWKAGS